MTADGPRREYELRLEQRRQAVLECERQDRSIAFSRLVVAVAAAAQAFFAWRWDTVSWWWLAVPAVAFLASDVDVFGLSPPGVDLKAVTVPVCREGDPLVQDPKWWLYEVCSDASQDPVYSDTDHLGCGGVNWFTQAAEDARKTIWYLHNWSIPEFAY